MKRLMRHCTMHTAVYDGCVYNLKPPNATLSEFIMKRAKVVSNIPSISRLNRKCPGKSSDHEHIHAIDYRIVNGKRASVAQHVGRYTPDLRSTWARIVADVGDGPLALSGGLPCSL